jgi:hypothetical protein
MWLFYKHLPTISFTSDYLKDIANAQQYSLKYNDYYVDTDLKIVQKGGTEVDYLILNLQDHVFCILYHF